MSCWVFSVCGLNCYASWDTVGLYSWHSLLALPSMPWGNIKTGNNLSLLVKTKLLLYCVFLMWKEYWMRKERLILAHTPHLAQHSPWGGYSGREWSFFETFDGGNWRAPLLLDLCRNQDCFLEKDITSSKGPSIDQLCFCVMAWQNNCRLDTPVGYLIKSPGWEWPENDNVVNGLDISKNNYNFF